MKKVIIVDDDELLRKLLTRKLKEEGYEVVLAVDGKEGVEKIKEGKPDLILMDIVMPNMDGFQAMEEIQKDESISHIPIVVVSNSGQPVEIDRAKKLGASDWLVKTEFDPQEVINKVIAQIGEGEKTTDIEEKREQ